MNIIAFGDIHGCFEAAERAVKLAEDLQVQALFLGDYVDRGPSAVETLRILIRAKELHPDWIFLRGNHDQMLLDLINGAARTTDIGEVLGMNYGYNQAAASYQEWQETEPEVQQSIRSFLNATVFFHETQSFIFCHAVLNNLGGNINEKSAQLLLWNYDYQPLWQGKTFVHGHLPVDSPAIKFHGINLNTSCGYRGFLTGLYIKEAEHENELTFYHITENGVHLHFSTINFKQHYTEFPRLIIHLGKANKYLELTYADLPYEMTWHDAMNYAKALGAGWRLPSCAEFCEIYDQLNEQEIGDFKATHYWCDDDDLDGDAVYFGYQSGGYSSIEKSRCFHVRLVRDLI